jgi:hypothetical protein
VEFIKSRQSGYTVLETSIALTIAMLIGFFVVQFIQNATEVEQIISSADVIAELENRVRAAVLHPGFKSITANKLSHPGNKKLNQCLTPDEKNCSKRYRPFILWRFRHEAITGGFTKKAALCKGSCPVVIKTQFLGKCTRKQCDVAQMIRVKYQIFIEGNKIRSGVVNRMIKTRRISDLNNSCGADDSDRPKFVESISGTDLKCGEVEARKAKITGLVPGSCKKGKEVFVGVNRATKRIICEKVRFK